MDVYQDVISSFYILLDAPSRSDFGVSLWVSFKGMDPLAVAVILMSSYAIYCFTGTTLTGDCSYVDRLWSIVPVVYSWTFALHPSDIGRKDRSRPVLIACLVTAWGVRLTYNFWRRGGYSGEEDYRWVEVRKIVPRVCFPLFNFFIISWFQHALLMAITVPAYLARRQASALNWLDGVAVISFCFFLALETMADQQQWTFQNEKYLRRREGRPLDGDFGRGFRTSGLFRYSRHPNFFAEQSIWGCIYLFSVAATGSWLNWSIAGWLVLMLLFQGSTRLTEGLSSAKYPLYVDYQRVTSRFIPLPPSGEVPHKQH